MPTTVAAVGITNDLAAAEECGFEGSSVVRSVARFVENVFESVEVGSHR